MVHTQGFDICEGEVPDVITAVGPCAARESIRDVGDPIEMHVMQNDQFVIPRCDHVLLKIVGTHRIREGFCGAGVFRQVTTGTTVRNDDRSHILNHLNKNN